MTLGESFLMTMVTDWALTTDQSIRMPLLTVIYSFFNINDSAHTSIPDLPMTLYSIHFTTIANVHQSVPDPPKSLHVHPSIPDPTRLL